MVLSQTAITTSVLYLGKEWSCRLWVRCKTLRNLVSFEDAVCPDIPSSSASLSGSAVSDCLKKLPSSCHNSFIIWWIQLYQDQGSAESWEYEHPVWHGLGCKQLSRKWKRCMQLLDCLLPLFHVSSSRTSEPWKTVLFNWVWTTPYSLHRPFAHIAFWEHFISIFPLRSYKIAKNTNQLAELQRRSCATVSLHILQINHLLNICTTSVFWIGCIVSMLGTY